MYQPILGQREIPSGFRIHSSEFQVNSEWLLSGFSANSKWIHQTTEKTICMAKNKLPNAAYSFWENN